MPLVECKQGNAEVTAGGTAYAFQKDVYGRFVATIDDTRHLACFLAREDMYREVPRQAPDKRPLWPGEIDPDAEIEDEDQDDGAPEKPARARRPRKASAQDAGATDAAPGLDGSQQTGEE